MLELGLRSVAIACTVLLLGGWLLFAIDEARSASQATTAEIAGREAAARAVPTPGQERDRERAHGDARELVDDVNDVLLAPFAPLTDGTDSQWVRRSLPALLGLLLYGFGLAALARASSTRAVAQRYVSTRVPIRTQP